MPQQERVAWAQLRVGVMVIIGLAILAVGIFFISGQVGFFTQRYTLKTYLSEASGLRDGAEVRLAGVAVGNVKSVQISPYTDRSRAVEIVMACRAATRRKSGPTRWPASKRSDCWVKAT